MAYVHHEDGSCTSCCFKSKLLLIHDGTLRPIISILPLTQTHIHIYIYIIRYLCIVCVRAIQGKMQKKRGMGRKDGREMG